MDIQKEGELFEIWWENHGQYNRAGGGDYEKTFAWESWIAAKAQAVPEGFVVCKSEPVAYIVQNKFWKQKFDVKSVKDMPPQKWEDDHYDVEIPLYAVSLDGLVLKEQDEDEAND